MLINKVTAQFSHQKLSACSSILVCMIYKLLSYTARSTTKVQFSAKAHSSIAVRYKPVSSFTARYISTMEATQGHSKVWTGCMIALVGSAAIDVV